MSSKSSTLDTDAAIWERTIRFEGELSSTAARALLKLRFSPRDHECRNSLLKLAKGFSAPQKKSKSTPMNVLGACWTSSIPGPDVS